MESTVFFEKKLVLTPTDFNKLKTVPLDDILLKKAKELLENKCSEHGFVLSDSLRLLSRSVGYFEPARFTGDAVYYVKVEGKVIYPIDGYKLIGEVIRKNKMGLYVNYKNAIHIQIPRDLHLDNQEYDEVEVGQHVRIVIKRSKFAVYDPYILASGLFLEVVDDENDEYNEEEYNEEESNEEEYNEESNVNEEEEEEEEEELEDENEEELSEDENLEEEEEEEEEEVPVAPTEPVSIRSVASLKSKK